MLFKLARIRVEFRRLMICEPSSPKFPFEFNLKPWPWAWALFFGALGLVFFSRHLDFTAFAHPDEASKIAQIVERSHNLHHPLLLLNSARAIAEVTGRHWDFEFVKLAGRWCSVIFSSLGVALLVLACGRLHGSFVAAAAGVFLISNPMVFELAHYFKEDPALFFGIALSLVAMLVFSSKKTGWAAVFLGLASTCAASGKFAGALVIPCSIYIVWVCSPNRRRHVVVMLAFVQFIDGFAAFKMVSA